MDIQVISETKSIPLMQEHMVQSQTVLPEAKVMDMRNAGFIMVGRHSAVKACHYTKKSLGCKGTCYKKKFYGIESHRCVQMSPAVFCNLRCKFCWRDLEVFSQAKWSGKVDDHVFIIDGCIKGQVQYLQGFGGNPNTPKEKWEEAKEPMHFAISLTGEPTLYPRLPEMIEELSRRQITSFLVTNGTLPDNLAKLKDSNLTQLYITVASHDKETYEDTTQPLMATSFERLRESLKLMKQFKARRVVRLTLVKGLNMVHPEKYAELLKDVDFDFLEAKGYMWVGYSQDRLGIGNMPYHEEIAAFSKVIAEKLGLKILDEDSTSRVVLMSRNTKERFIAMPEG